MSHCHEQYVTASLAFLCLEISKLTFTLRPLNGHAGQLLSPDAVITVEGWEL